MDDFWRFRTLSHTRTPIMITLLQVTLILQTDYYLKFIMLLYVDAVIFDLDIKYFMLREKENIILKLHNSIHSDVHKFVKV